MKHPYLVAALIAISIMFVRNPRRFVLELWGILSDLAGILADVAMIVAAKFVHAYRIFRMSAAAGVK
jgi:hypothetical protein